VVICYGIGKYAANDKSNPGTLFIVQELLKGGSLLHKVRGSACRMRASHAYTRAMG
jgi:hypothetical protein